MAKENGKEQENKEISSERPSKSKFVIKPAKSGFAFASMKATLKLVMPVDSGQLQPLKR